MAEASAVESTTDEELILYFAVAVLESNAADDGDDEATVSARINEYESVRAELLRRMAAAREENSA